MASLYDKKHSEIKKLSLPILRESMKSEVTQLFIHKKFGIESAFTSVEIGKLYMEIENLHKKMAHVEKQDWREILVSLVLDAVDQTIFQQFPGLDLSSYQGYDKALDIYYLSIAYISTLRNWKNLFAFQVSRFLFYWRLVGVALFELTQRQT